MATVFIWNNNMATVMGHSYPGHASLSIDDAWDDQTNRTYVSFWPDGHASLWSGRIGARKTTSLLKDIDTEGYVPDHIIRLNGLDTAAMRSAWVTTTNAYQTYSMQRQNCANAVAQVLKAGAETGGFMKRHNAVWTPLKIKRLALAMGGAALPWAELLQEFRRAGRLGAQEVELLQTLGKRDERHGSSTASAYFAHGVRQMPRVLITSEGMESNKFSVTGGGAMTQATGKAPHIHVTCGGTLHRGNAWMDDHDKLVSDRPGQVGRR